MKKIFFYFLIIILFVNCKYNFQKHIVGNENNKTEKRVTNAFKSISVSGNFSIEIEQADICQVTVYADENLFPYVKTYVDDNELNISVKEDYSLDSKKSIKIVVSVPQINTIKCSGSNTITSLNTINNSQSISISSSGSCKINLKINTPSLQGKLSGASFLLLEGQTKNEKIDASGAVNIKNFNLLAENVILDLNGVANAEVFASVKLDLNASGAAQINYKGNGEVNQNISGGAKINNAN